MHLEEHQEIPLSKAAALNLRIHDFARNAVSPLRYPGGKTWFLSYSNAWLALQNKSPRVLVEPFAGGASVSLSALFNNLVPRVILSETNPKVAAVWRVTLSKDYKFLQEKILSFRPVKKNVLNILSKTFRSDLSIAFQTIIANRFKYGGIMASGSGFPRYGDSGSGLSQRWYPETVSERLGRINSYSNRISFFHGCGYELIRDLRLQTRTCFFVDPPYNSHGAVAGQRLYEHKALHVGDLLNSLDQINGKYLLTFSPTSDLDVLLRKFRIGYTLVPMKTSHHRQKYEIVVTNDEHWKLVCDWSLEV